MSKRSALQGKRTELERKIKDLGSLPSEAFEKYRDYTLQELHKLLQKANTQLKKFMSARTSLSGLCFLPFCLQCHCCEQGGTAPLHLLDRVLRLCSMPWHASGRSCSQMLSELMLSGMISRL